MRWLAEHEEFRDQYARAHEQQADRLLRKCLEIADNKAVDVVRSKDENGKEVVRVDHENIQRARLRIDTRKWMLGSWLPRNTAVLA